VRVVVPVAHVSGRLGRSRGPGGSYIVRLSCVSVVVGEVMTVYVADENERWVGKETNLVRRVREYFTLRASSTRLPTNTERKERLSQATFAPNSFL
jgi:hypothetical protein